MGPLPWSVALALFALALPVSAAQRKHSFQVRALVIRSAVVRSTASVSGTTHLTFTGPRAPRVEIDSTPLQTTAAGGELTLPAGTRMVTIQY
ncbi:MAG TPA: hypothetical protein VEP66_01370 [Myxococcales bacterium]|nr:hypothetical protein [Myxococcales bacterium]